MTTFLLRFIDVVKSLFEIIVEFQKLKILWLLGGRLSWLTKRNNNC